MTRILRIAAQFLLYLPLLAIVGWFSTEPHFRVMEEDQALLRLSLIHAAERRHPCRERSAEELSKLAPNMRAALDCPRERANLVVELEVDGEVVLRREAEPAGLQRDGNAVIYERLVLPAGRHRIVARLRDRAEGGFNHVRDETVELSGGRVLVIDFNAAQGGFLFRG